LSSAAAPPVAAPDYIEPVVAWRMWRVVERDGVVMLRSLFQDADWPALEPLVARCTVPRLVPWRWVRERHPAPTVNCTCGIYAAPWEVIAPEVKRVMGSRRPKIVVGQVSLWGTVVEAERGWRASFAYPRSLFVPFSGKGDPFDQFRLLSGLERYETETELVDLGSLAPKLADIARQA
jgi:hypothetical protein